jgi:predicted GTPase
VTAAHPEAIRGKRVVVLEDGPTLTHGGMPTGAGWVAAAKYGAAQVVDPRPYFRGEMAGTLARYPHIGPVVPAMGYSAHQVGEVR